MSFRSKLLLIPGLILACSGWAVHAETLREVVAEALRSDPRIAGAQADVEAMRARIELAGRASVPQVSLEAATGKQRYDSVYTRAAGTDGDFFPRRLGSLSANWQFADFGVTANRVAAASERATAAEHRAARAEGVTVIDIVEAYLDVWSARRLLELAEDNRATHKRLVVTLAQRSKADLSPRYRYEEMLGRGKAIEDEIADIRSALRRAEEAFRLVCGRLPGATLALPEGNPLEGVDISNVTDLLQLALATHPEIKANDRLIEAAAREVDAARSMIAPTLSAEARHGYDNFNSSSVASNSAVRDTTVMLKLRWTLYGELVSDRVNDAAAVRKQLTAERDRHAREIERILRLAIDNIHINTELLQSLVHPTEGRIHITEAVWRAAKTVLEQKSQRDDDIFRAADAKRNAVTTQAAAVNVTRQKLKAQFSLLDVLGLLKPVVMEVPHAASGAGAAGQRPPAVPGKGV